MLYFANPCNPSVVDVMRDNTLGYIDTPAQGNTRPADVQWCADNGCFSNRWDETKWWKFLTDNAHASTTCAFAVAPDVVADAEATWAKSAPWLPRIRALGYPAALVAQDGMENQPVQWESFDVLFIGGSTEWKLGPHARQLAAEAKRRGKRIHMGRVNSEKRYRYAEAIGCDSVDGTFLTFGPDKNLPRLMAWLRSSDQAGLFEVPS